jgi:tagatose 1,6-diphosphate aldolase
VRVLTPGKLRGMTRIGSPRGVIAVTAIDHRASLEAMLARARPGRPNGFAELAAEKVRIARALAPLSTAVLLDPLYGLPAIVGGAVPGHVGLAMCLEEFAYGGGSESRVTTAIEGWSVARIKRMGADAVKLLLFYHPRAGAASRQEDFVKRTVDECDRHDVPLLLEPISYPIEAGRRKESAEFARERPELVIESARRLGGLGVDLLKAEFPDDPRFQADEGRMRAHCRALTEASPVPWVLLSAGEGFDRFQRLAALACQEGASGFMAGRAIWQEAMALPEAADRARFLATTAVSRLRILTAIADAHATPWTARFGDPASGPTGREGWHRGYGEPGSPALP